MSLYPRTSRAAHALAPWHRRLLPADPLAQWLRAPGSLSTQLARVFGTLTVQRIHQGRGRLRRDEAAALGLPAGQRVHVREVVLRCGGQPLVAARTVVETAALKGPWRALKGLGSRPLAELLFHDRRVRREAPACARLRLNDPTGRALKASWAATTDCPWTVNSVWARRAIYRRGGRALLVAEVFDPAVAAHAPRKAR